MLGGSSPNLVVHSVTYAKFKFNRFKRLDFGGVKDRCFPLESNRVHTTLLTLLCSTVTSKTCHKLRELKTFECATVTGVNVKESVSEMCARSHMTENFRLCDW